MSGGHRGAVRVLALAKINLTLRVCGRHADGYHDIRTVFQSIALADRLTVVPADGPFALQCSDLSCPSDERNLVWQAAERLWRAAKRRGAPAGVRVTLEKNIPSEAGLGGGSSDAAAALRTLNHVWDLRIEPDGLRRIAAGLGADVPFFLQGGTALGVGRGDTIFPLADVPPQWVVIAKPAFGVRTADAYRWLDEAPPGGSRRRRAPGLPAGWTLPPSDLGNDLQAPVVARHRGIGRLIRALERRGAGYAAMSGSGSAVFALFETAAAARAAAQALRSRAVQTLLTRTRSGRQARAASKLRIRGVR